MKNYRRLVVIVMAVTLVTAAVPSGARELKGIDFPDQIQAGSDPQAILQSSTPKMLILHFLRDQDRRDQGFNDNLKDGLLEVL